MQYIKDKMEYKLKLYELGHIGNCIIDFVIFCVIINYRKEGTENENI